MSKNPHKNKLKTAVAIALVVSFATMAAIIAVATFKGEDTTVTNIESTASTESESVDAPATPDPLATPQTQQTNTQTAPTTATPQPTAPATIPCGTKNGTCTKAQVAAHNSQTDCWVIYKNSYYNVTSYISTHPGGKKVFNSQTCGTDIESFMNGSASSAGESNKHDAGAYKDLASYIVGPVTN